MENSLLERLNVLEKDMSTQFDICCYLLKQHNVRSAQLIRARLSDFYYPHLCILPAVKNSRPVIIKELSVLTAIHRVKVDTQPLIFPYVKYHQLYRHFKRYYSHLYPGNKKRKHIPATHVFRYINARLPNDVEAIQEILYHKSVRSQSYYIT